MYQFFVEEHQLTGDKIAILGSDVNHIKNVLRMKGGERVRVSLSDSGRSFFCVLDTITEEEVIAQIQEEDEAGTELKNKIYLFQGLPKGDKMELIIQKCVELGVYEIIPVAMKNCVVKLDAKKADSKVKRWQAISESAAKQSKRMVVPEIHSVMKFSEALKYVQDMDIKLIPYENAKGMEATREVMGRIKGGQSIAFFIGPEGGFDETEVEAAQAAGVLPVSLGKRILRTETAGLTLLSILMYHLED
jgi:16S rRNA (uracil1498-N3)-methyltransferase